MAKDVVFCSTEEPLQRTGSWLNKHEAWNHQRSQAVVLLKSFRCLPFYETSFEGNS